ncbi:MAG: carboxypeptidase-like regulatory domain-containing protein [Polyangiaceae bacterium]|jgi:hypothetical protein|nr:carboxypeptidase-like regulatory domain-containing protein [Polyangiaceae bacterium]
MFAGGCRRGEAQQNQPTPAASARASASASAGAAPNGLPFAPEKIAAVINPGNLPVYQGPFGAVAGRITIKGDPPPRRAGTQPDLKRCGKEAIAENEMLFRVSPDGGLADAIVGVTGYKAFLPVSDPVVPVKIRGCTFDQRTVVMTFGQRLEVQNLDPREPYLPHLEGAKSPALLVAMPGGDPIKLLPPQPGAYMLLDDLKHPWMSAEVFVFKFPTATVSDRSGKFKVERVPVGEVKVSVRHPDIGQTVERTVQIEADKTVEINLELSYQTPKAAPSSSAPRLPEIH